MSDLSSNALLVSLNISQWAARKLDKRETLELAIKHGTAEGIARVNKSLIPQESTLTEIGKLAGTIRTDFYKHVLPWSEGQAIIKADTYIAFAQKMADYKNQFDALADRFEQEYPQLRANAQRALNGLWDASDYPDAWAIRGKFSMEVSFQPVPAPADCKRVSILADLADGMAKDLAEKLNAKQRNAMQDAWRRVFDVVSKAHERLADPDNIFRDSLVENAIELCGILPSLNLSNDADLEHMRQELEGSLCRYNADTLRKDTAVRSEVADKMKDIMSTMSAFYRPE